MDDDFIRHGKTQRVTVMTFRRPLFTARGTKIGWFTKPVTGGRFAAVVAILTELTLQLVHAFF
jgi:hypothetical protein